ncbi:MAG TPA: indole-3-glycerol-phosphate synthase TrpC, partial [Salinimicrobium sp.]|nr:indole-3-glycerol-phosphate synthase TrpC [Salinimicrobium sp.]
MDILEKIATAKRKEVALKLEMIPVEALELLTYFERKCISLSNRLEKSETGIIAEFKRKSPSVFNINLKADIEKIPFEYEKAGAAGISILTDEEFFGGSNDDLFIA